MLSRVNGVVWMDDITPTATTTPPSASATHASDPSVSWTQTTTTTTTNDAPSMAVETQHKDDLVLSTFKSMLEDDWYPPPPPPPLPDFHHHHHNFSSSSYQPFLKSSSSLLNPFDAATFDIGGCDAASGFLLPPPPPPPPEETGLGGFGDLGPSDLGPGTQFGGTHLFGQIGFGGFEGSPFLARSKVLRPLEIFPSTGSPPTLFQKRAAALRQTVSEKGLEEQMEKKRRWNVEEDEFDDASVDGSGLNYDSDEGLENVRALEGNSNSNNSAVTGGGGGDQKGKKKGLPAKNLMAERRRRKKLNDRLYMLRSVVPKISKMDRASILGDAIDYLKELLQRINDLHNELESTPSSSSLPSTTATTPTTASFHPLTPTPPTLPCRVKEELSPSSLPSPNSQPARVEVRMREGRAVNIHMFCPRRPGLLISTMSALDALGLDIQQAVISCFNGFALDVFRAEQCKEGPNMLPDDIKQVLLQSAGINGTM